jgi:uncharacterized protein (DUF885 family)
MSDTPSQTDQFDAWLDAFFDSYYERRPVNATFIGRHEYDDQLPDYFPDAVEQYVDDIDQLQDDLEEFDPSTLPDARRIDYELAAGALEIQRWELTGDHFHRSNPCLYTGEAIFGVLGLFLTSYAPLEERASSAISRMNAIPEWLEQGRRKLDSAPAWWIERAINECDGALSLFETDIHEFARSNDISDQEFSDAADRAASAFQEFKAFLETELRENATEDYAAGEDALSMIVERGHFRDETLDGIVSFAEDKLREAEKQLESGADKFNAESWQEALSTLQRSHPSVEEYYERHQELWEEGKREAVEHDIVTWPDYPLEFRPRPEWTRELAQQTYFLYYRAPAPYDDTTPVEYLLEPVEPSMDDEVIERRLKRWNDSVIKQNHVAHHGGIGHHVQNYRANECDSRIGQMAAVDTASRIALVCGGTMAEGWAPYATSLMAETDYYTELETYALNKNQLKSAARAIVDVKLHRGEMSAQEASQWYQDRVGLPSGLDLSGAGYEVVKNSMFPGMALMYLLGPHTISELRTELHQELGQEFSLRQFHDDVLSFGSVPATIISRELKSKYLCKR